MTLPPEDELVMLDQEIRLLQNRHDNLGRERARVVNEPELGQAMWRLRDRLARLKADRERLVADIQHQDEAA